MLYNCGNIDHFREVMFNMKILFNMINDSLQYKAISWSQNVPSMYGLLKSYSQPILCEGWVWTTNSIISRKFFKRKLLMLWPIHATLSHQMLSWRRICFWFDRYLSWTRGRAWRTLWKMAGKIIVKCNINVILTNLIDNIPVVILIKRGKYYWRDIDQHGKYGFVGVAGHVYQWIYHIFCWWWRW